MLERKCLCPTYLMFIYVCIHHTNYAKQINAGHSEVTGITDFFSFKTWLQKLIDLVIKKEMEILGVKS